jgi:hypothetical protein
VLRKTLFRDWGRLVVFTGDTARSGCATKDAFSRLGWMGRWLAVVAQPLLAVAARFIARSADAAA